jgi:SAM-dependent methyltransferase
MDPEPFKQVAKMLWSLGDYREVAKDSEAAARELVDACKARPGIELLDVAAGNGNVAIAAAWRGAKVVASDLTPAMVELGRERSAADGVDIEWHEADVEALPFEDGRFDIVTSAFGAMFAPRPDVAASEMFRVLRPRGILGMLNWTPQGFLGQSIELMGRYSPPRPPEMLSPMTWGDPDIVKQRLSGRAASVHCEPKMARSTFASEAAMLASFQMNLGPMVALKNLLPEETYAEMLDGFTELISGFDRGQDEVVIDSEYLLVTAEKNAG